MAVMSLDRSVQGPAYYCFSCGNSHIGRNGPYERPCRWRAQVWQDVRRTAYIAQGAHALLCTSRGQLGRVSECASGVLNGGIVSALEVPFSLFFCLFFSLPLVLPLWEAILNFADVCFEF